MSASPTIGLITLTDYPSGTRPGDWRVTLDGKRVDLVTAANDVEGWLERYASDLEGHAIHNGQEFVREQLTGAVRLIYCGNNPDYAAFKDTPSLT